MSRNLLLASVGAFALATSAALAADLPSRAPPPVYVPPAPIFTWTGIYVGGQIGYAWGSGNLNYTGFDPFLGAGLATSVGGTPSGVIGGAHVGYNYQINQWVVGLEGTVDGTSLSNTTVAFFPDGTNIQAQSTADIQGSIRGRAGVAWDRALIYATGGVAFGGFNTNYSVFNSGALGILPAFYANNSFSNTRVGWTVGGGIDYAVTNNWSIFAEYRYTNWGTLSAPSLGAIAIATNPLLAGVFYNANRTLNQNQVQVGFSYKFDLYGPPAPVVSKY
ncbi:MAG TPA: outer membrane beta-barrel protein [Methylocella sp.]|nr:outer membrane beta-barrel protein [Methylocella sp.]